MRVLRAVDGAEDHTSAHIDGGLAELGQQVQAGRAPRREEVDEHAGRRRRPDQVPVN